MRQSGARSRVINRILEPSVAKMLSEQTLSAPSGRRHRLHARDGEYRYLFSPDTKATDLGLFTPIWNFIVTGRGPWWTV